MAHLELTTSYQSAENLGPKRIFVLQTTDKDAVISIRCAVDTSDMTDGVEIGVIDFKHPVLRMEDGAVALKYLPLSGSVTGAVWVDADAAPVTVAATEYTPGDAGDYDAVVTTEGGALDQLAQRLRDVETETLMIPIPIFSGLLAATGAPMAVFADGASSVPGVQVTNSKVDSVRWNNHATPGAISVTVDMPPDLNDTVDVTFKALVSKIGATSGDATKLTVGAFQQTLGALHDAGSDFGGDTTAVTGNATSKTVQEVSLTLAHANIAASPSSITFTIKPKDGTLGTDDFCLHSARLEAVRAA
jgi:hypothetical protein